MKIPLTDLKAQHLALKDEIDQAIKQTVEGTQFILGPEVKALEKDIAAYLGVKYAIGVASGTDALLISMLSCGITSGDEVITTPFTFVATSETISRCGAVPVFVDIDSQTFNIDTAKIEKKITKKTKAILPVHLYGQPANMDDILRLARKYNLKVIEDCAQAFGAAYRGRKIGSFGDAGCLSFFPSKMLGAYGDGGMIVTNDEKITEKAEMLRNHGGKDKYFVLLHGFNSRLDSLQAAVLRVKLKYINKWIEQRQQKAKLYAKLLGGLAGISVPGVAPHCDHVFNYYTIRAPGRDDLQKHLDSQGIGTAIYYPLPLHLQEVYRTLGYKAGDFPASERIAKDVLSLPMYPEIENRQIEFVVEQIKQFYKHQAT
ncbi:MAG: DegT/DnrJ/EryC1/StrS family aminotransferase [Dehalococcoidales bacterium]